MLAEMLANRFFERTLSTKKPRLSGASARADERIRTADPFITSEVLYQLSYVGKRPANPHLTARWWGAPGTSVLPWCRS